ncbi:CoA ester lyase [Frankia sp. Cj5]|uniref:HpcH/HpaI aldolase/citrate lyase family protein n=2 Tax=unclassified Frankia TaxID=2632575 RepID=UPI001EF5352A|nr:CoA ester lyase [Frankia sp. Cj5]
MSSTPAGTAALAYRPRRSVLYMPAANERALEKARGIPADALILDLEDAVAPDAKEAARERACAKVADQAYGGREVTIRVNGLDTRWHTDDLRAVAAAGPDGVVVPKISCAQDVHAVEKSLEAAGAPDRTRIWAMVETPVAMLHAEEIARASQRLAVLVMGTNDLANELHAEHVPGRAPLLPGLGLCLLAARAVGVAILDGVFNDIRDLDGFEAECVQGRQLGFDGKTLIHPGQVEPCNRVFAPAPAQVEESKEILAAWEAALASGHGVATVNGRMIENLHVNNARRILAVSEAIAALDREAAAGTAGQQ